MVGNVPSRRRVRSSCSSDDQHDPAESRSPSNMVPPWRCAGSEMVRITVDRDEVRGGRPHIRDELRNCAHHHA